ncbi:MAG: hypothetical protein AAF938_23730 [Myxococcota bacterium]
MNELLNKANAVVTNRDLYCLIADLIELREKHRLSLETYLMNLRMLAEGMRDRPTISGRRFATWLVRAFEATERAPEQPREKATGYERWETLIQRQIQDLRDMAECGTFENELRYFGVDSPSGYSWYNFDPLTFLECAVAGTFGGWQEGDNTGRIPLPGGVPLLGPDRSLIDADAQADDDSVGAIHPMNWRVLHTFLEMGQYYE